MISEIQNSESISTPPEIDNDVPQIVLDSLTKQTHLIVW